MRTSRSASEADENCALFALDIAPSNVLAGDWPGGASDLGEFGLFSWWVDAAGATELI